MLALPKRFLKFFFLSSLGFFGRSWVHTISLIEEDLAVGLMFRLLFVPLFHDSSIVGRVLSFFFRLSRIALGIIAYAMASILVLIASLAWFLGWVIFLVPAAKLWGFVYIGFVLSLFIDRVAFYPAKTVGSLKRKRKTPLGVLDVWETTKLTSKDLLWQTLLKKVEVKNLLETLEVSSDAFNGYNPILNNDTILKALELAQKTGAKYLTSDYFFVSLLSAIAGIENNLLKLNLTSDDFLEALSFQEQKRTRKRYIYIWDSEFGVKHLKGVNRGWLGAPTPWLDSVSVDLTREAARVGFDEFLGRKDVLLEVINILSQSKGRNVLLVGPAGTGKSSLVNYLAKVIVAGDAPESFATKRLVSLDLSRLLAGVTSQGDLAGKIKNIFDEVRSIGGIVIYIDEIQNLGIGDAGSSFNLYSLLLPEMESSDTQFLASTEPENFARILEKDSSFARLFTKVEVPPATLPETIEILKNQSLDMERWEGISLTYKAIKALANLSHDLIHDRVLPDSALANLEECKVNKKNGWITEEVVRSVIQKRVNIPVGEVTGAQKDELLNLENLIHERMVDQVEAVTVIANTLRRSATALREKNRPIGSFLFVGPTGVGKCVTPDTMIFTEKGMLYIEDFVPKSNFPEGVDKQCSVTLYSIDGQEKTSRIYSGGVKKTILIKTKLGYDIEGTFVHPILVLGTDGKVKFKQLKQITIGDHVIIQRNQNFFGKSLDISFDFKKAPHDYSSHDKRLPKELSKDVARLLGYLVGEATTTNNTAVRFTNKDSEVVNDLKKILQNEFNLKLFHYNSDHKIDYWIHSVKFRKFLYFCGLNYVTASDMEVPRVILRAPREVVAEYLKGYFEAEGSVITSSRYIEVSSASEKMVKQLHIILLNFGIVANRRKTFNKKLQKYYYRLEIRGENVAIFSRQIGFVSLRKRSKLATITNQLRNPNIDIIPFMKPYLRALKERYLEEGYSYTGDSPACLQSWYTRDISYITLEKLLKAHEAIKEFSEYKQLELLNHAKYLYVPVTEIIFGESQVYDFVVPKTHTFFSNGFISHNTELAKILSETYFKNTAAFTRFDMSEYQTEEAVNRLLGTIDSPGELTEAIKNKPYSLILLDEFEKADPKILTLFLQVLDDGRLTDARGVTVDFTNTIIIATSNAASLLIAQSLEHGTNMDALKESVKGELLKTFKPELVNRFDEVVIFKPLSQEDLEKIVLIKLKSLKDLMKEKGYLIDFSPELISELARRGFDPVLGARPLRRLIQDSLEAKLSRMMLENKLTKGQNFLAGKELVA